MDVDYELIRTREVRSQKKINFPDKVQRNVSFEHRAHGESVEWHYEENEGVAVISNDRLSDERYVHIKRANVMDDGVNIRPPNDLIEDLSRPIYKGMTTVYLAHEDMLEGDIRSVYLLTESQAFTLIGERTDDSKELREVLSNTPRFLPIPE
ncbi:hypothetical protein EGH24_06050 [Halonotius terrestris]|uniref:Uncharacterized protein n=1 Tax=Halonotius terrestris TaxID=2487750 RepID=A0A8J8PA21_9EURY|nr:hypothetical protein [Halonotius terrestris]TQQ82994.1 hypothetical protein EGH24_06050 [Halonotius terrestris]